MISHKWLYLADIFEHQIMLMNNLRNFPPVTLGIFQSTLLQEERLKLKYIQNGNSYFNPRSYKRSDNDFQSRYSWDYDFNPRSYKRSDIVGICLCVGYVVFQSTLLQEERLKIASVRNALLLFQSTLLQEERQSDFLKIWQIWFYFNPRSYKRSDHEFRSNNLQAETISIHAPTRGATRSRHYVPLLWQHFNPRSYKRSDAVQVPG